MSCVPPRIRPRPQGTHRAARRANARAVAAAVPPHEALVCERRADQLELGAVADVRDEALQRLRGWW